MSNLAKLEDIKIDIRCLLVSRNSENVTLPLLNKFYKDITDEDIPYTDFNYTSLKQFLASMHDVLYLENNAKNELCAYHIETEKSKHISNLVSKERKETSAEKRKTLLKNNFINPGILNEILSELCISATPNDRNTRIKKIDVLSGIKNKIGEYTFYTEKDLDNQLNELSHILYYNNEYIIFKADFSQQVKKKIKNKKQDACVTNEIDKSIKDFTQDNSVSDLIKQRTKERLQNLIEKYHEGIWCSELPKLYQREFKLDLEYKDLGFNSIIEFVGALPDILKIVTPASTRKHLVLDARISVDNYEKYETSNLNCENNFLENIDKDDPIPKILSPKVIESLLIDDVLYDDTIDQINIISTQTNFQNDFDVIVSEVHNPSFFWIHSRKNTKIINNLMENLQEFYTNQDLSSYRIPQLLVKQGIHVACLFDNKWHRGIIKKITPKGPMIHFYDYGTDVTYDSEDLYYLNKKFSTIPAQAIPCTLCNVKPVGANKWSLDVCKKFTERVFDKPFTAYISSIDHERNSMVVDLEDVSRNLNQININSWLVENKIAEWGTPVVPEIIFTLKYCKQYMQKLSLESSSNDTNSKKEIDIKHKTNTANCKTPENGSINHFGSDKKLKILRKYKAKSLNNL